MNFKKIIMRLTVIILILLSGCRELVKRESVLPEVTTKDLHHLVSKPQSNAYPPPQAVSKINKTTLPIIATKEMQSLVSINVCEAMPLSQVFVELARQAKVDLQLECGVDKRIIFSAHNKPLIRPSAEAVNSV